MYRQPLGEAVVPALEQLAGDLPPSEFRDATLAWLGATTGPRRPSPASFAGALAELLGSARRRCASTAPIRRPSAPRRPTLRAGAASRPRARSTISTAGPERQGGTARTSGVTVGDGAALVMVEASLGRDRLVQDGDGFVTRREPGAVRPGGTRSGSPTTSPTRLSPNVLLRPVVESALLPTVAYLGGPGELRYLALTPPVYQRLGVARQLPMPRWSGVMVEPRVDRVLEKFGVDARRAARRRPARSRRGWSARSFRRR